MQLQDLSAGHGTLTAVQAGEGADLVVLHSLLADRHAFDPVLPALAARHSVTLFNLPGFHGSQPTLLALMDAYVACIEDGFDELKIGSDAILIGNGFGGTLALAFAFAHPERLAKLVLSDAAASFPPEGRAAFAAMAEKVEDGGLGAVAEIAAKRVYSPAYLAAHPEAVEQRKAVLMGIDAESVPGRLQDPAGDRPDARARQNQGADAGRLRRIRPGDAAGAQQAVADKIKGARYVELPGCGHCPPLEQPQAFLAAIKDFVGL